MEKLIERNKPDVVSLRISLIRIKSFCALAIDHLEKVEQEELPDDFEFRQVFWTLLDRIFAEQEDLKYMTETVVLPGVDAPR